MDVHDVPSASKPGVNPTIGGITLGHESFYTYLRLRLPLEAGMVVVSNYGVVNCSIEALILLYRPSSQESTSPLTSSPQSGNPSISITMS